MTVTLPYTCGELVQGYLDGTDFHITCPIAHGGSVEATWGDPDASARRLPPKARAAMALVLPDANRQRQLRIRLPRQAAVGKGLASSSVDVLGVILAVSRFLELPMTDADASRMALRIEPTDGIAFPGITLFDHRRGSRQQSLGAASPLGILVIEPRGRINTVAFHRPRNGRRAEMHRRAGLWREATAMVGEGLALCDPALVARAATLSATHWQAMLYNPWLAPALEWGRRHGALGICRAHSGTVVGVLFAADRQLEAIARTLRSAVAGRACVWTTRLADGGTR